MGAGWGGGGGGGGGDLPRVSSPINQNTLISMIKYDIFYISLQSNMCHRAYANNESRDQPAHLCSIFRAFHHENTPI